MRSHHRSLLVILVLAALSIVVGTLADVYKWTWAGDWLAPALSLIYLITLMTFVGRTTGRADTRAVRVWPWARTAAVVVPICCFLSIEIVGEAPVAMRLFGLSWTMDGRGATRLLSFGGVIIGALVMGLAWMDADRAAAPAARADLVNTHTPPTPPGSTTAEDPSRRNS